MKLLNKRLAFWFYIIYIKLNKFKKGEFMRMYFKFVSFIVFLFIWFGFVGPHCISGNTEFAIGYSIITLILIPFTFKLFKMELLMFKKFLSNEIIEYEKVIN